MKNRTRTRSLLTLSTSLLSLFLLLFLAGCSLTPSSSPAEKASASATSTADVKGDSGGKEPDIWKPSKQTTLRKLVFNLPKMDKKMCETFPRVIISALESTPGVVDAGFVYDGHVVTVYYDPAVVKRDALLNHDSFAWVGTVFVSEDKSSLDPLRLFDDREANNDLVMPDEHMAGLPVPDKGYDDLSAPEFDRLIQNKDVFLVDVHIPEQQHIPGTDALIPFNAISENLGNLPADRSTPIAVYCRSGSMSKEASAELVRLGYTNVSNLIGGLNEWKLDSLPVG
ncbi:MAG: rhodanese-like domain-containing protein, partial [DPANN group archaeon]|nr:rhodanese-like domain-containing protein [DPANN group archaeon]